ncbi:UNVERIFIED_CONTAM: hypothetical protein FKN15_025056 [Acipenser sinensis]
MNNFWEKQIFSSLWELLEGGDQDFFFFQLCSRTQLYIPILRLKEGRAAETMVTESTLASGSLSYLKTNKTLLRNKTMLARTGGKYRVCLQS